MRHLSSFVAMLAIAIALAVHPVSPAMAAAGVTVTPTVASQTETFLFEGTDFAPGTLFAIVFQAPDGTQFSQYANGNPLTVTADGAGYWSFSLSPSTDLTGAPAGQWVVAVCSTESECFSGTFTIQL